MKKQWIYKLTLFVIMLILFTWYYYRELKEFYPSTKDRLVESLNISVLTQTLTGLYREPPKQSIKNMVMIQSFTGFLFMSGFILNLFLALNGKI